MLILFSRCLYLAYILPGNGTVTGNITDVPFTTCVMYDAQGGFYFFGSTWTVESASVADFQTRRETIGGLLDEWRRNHILSPALTALQDPAVLPEIEPLTVDWLAEAFYNDIRGRGLRARGPLISEVDAGAFALTIETSFLGEIPGATPLTHVPAEKDHLWSILTLKKRLMEFGKKLFKMRASADFDPDKLEFQTVFLAFLGQYLTPHIFPGVFRKPNSPLPPKPDLKKAEIEPPPTTAALILADLGPLWLKYKTDAINRFSDFMSDLPDYRNKGKFKPYGRCAETYGFGVMRPAYFAGVDASRVHGAAVDVRGIGQSMKFQTSFDSAAVDQSGDKKSV